MAEAYTNPQMEEDEEGIEIPVEFEEDIEKDQAPQAGGEAEEVVEEAKSQEESEKAPEPEGAQEPSEEEAEGADEQECECDEQAPEEEKAPEQAQEEKAPEGGEPEKKGFFGRRKKDKEKEKLEQQVGELTDRLKRSLAEFDNFRKRTEKEKSSMYAIGAKDIVEKMLPVLDSFERGLKDKEEGDPFVDGMRMVYKQMVTSLEEAGVTPIKAVGEPFDTNLHNAVMHVEDESVGENIVVEEFQKGYKYKDLVVRHSMVKVAN